MRIRLSSDDGSPAVEGEMPDVEIENQGTIFLFTPLTTQAQEWLEEHTAGMWWGRSLIVEPRYARDLAYGLTEEGYRVV